jgi:hypothetical protein
LLRCRSQATYFAIHHQYSAEVFVNNVTDRITQNRATFGSRGLNERFDAPRMFGVRVGARF